ncbi:MAG TPA: RNA polymerase sigma-70 factor [Gemmatimonadaceae bacterium]|nr:RNA polymerase sigma-70 factor [Gemmatimonadaceae bacterium]
MAGVRAGDDRAFEAMFRAYRDGLVAFAESLLRSNEAAQEVVQDLFLRIWQMRDLWEPRGALNAYLYRATRNRAIMRLRRHRAELSLHERLSNVDPATISSVLDPSDSRAEVADLESAISLAVAELPARCKEVFCLSRDHHLSNAQIADVMQISVKTVEVHMTRALGHLRRRLADWRGKD